MIDKRKFQVLLTDLIDTLTIGQIKEMLLLGEKRVAATKELTMLLHDIDLLLKDVEIKGYGRLLRLVVFLAQANLIVWSNKDRMQDEPEKYHELLEFAQEMNGLRNHIRNLLMEEFGEDGPCNTRATFLEYSDQRWYSSLIRDFEISSSLDAKNEA